MYLFIFFQEQVEIIQFTQCQNQMEKLVTTNTPMINL